MSGYLSYFGDGDSWFVISILATFTAILIYLILWMFSKMIQSDSLNRFSKAEAMQAGATLLMVVFIIFFIQSVEQFSISYFFGCVPGEVCTLTLGCGNEKTTNIENLGGVIGLLKCRFADKAMTMAEIQYYAKEKAETPMNLLNLYISIVGLPIFQGGYLENIWREVEGYRLATNITTNMLIGLNTATVVADYVKNTMLTVFLPLGLFLRSFHFTRGLGAFFMAFAIGMYFIYPVLYIVTDPGFIKPFIPPSSPQPGLKPCYPTYTGIINSLVTYTQPSGGSLGRLSLTDIIYNASSIYTSVILHPFVIFAVTLMFIRYMMQILGGETMSLMRMVARVV